VFAGGWRNHCEKEFMVGKKKNNKGNQQSSVVIYISDDGQARLAGR